MVEKSGDIRKRINFFRWFANFADPKDIKYHFKEKIVCHRDHISSHHSLYMCILLKYLT